MQESVVDSEEEGKRDLGNSSQNEGTAGLSLSSERSRRLVKRHSGGWRDGSMVIVLTALPEGPNTHIGRR